ncbi:MAG: AAA family ATPase [Deltaproteobacteria bacterium]|nr:AAA family ATPase [Deltaproteobacteria bacterium]
MYYEYWGLKKPPFDNVPDPFMYTACHVSMENAIAETIFAIDEGRECLAVIVGDVGLGKTFSIRIILDALDHELYRIALITNPSVTFVQLLREIIGQLTGEECILLRKSELIEAFNNLLFDVFEKGKRTLIVIDEGNALPSESLEGLRLLTNMQTNQDNLFTLLLSGQMEMAHRLEKPRHANLFQRIGTYCRLEKMNSDAMVGRYVESRLARAGGTRRIFNSEALAALWRHSDGGTPRLVNKIAKLALKAGETNGLSTIDAAVIEAVAERFQPSSICNLETRVSPSSSVVAAASGPQDSHGPLAEDSPFRIPEKLELSQESTDGQQVSCQAPLDSYIDDFEENNAGSDEGRVYASDAAVQEIRNDKPPRTTGTPEAVAIGPLSVTIEYPEYVIRKARTNDRSRLLRLAGFVAAQTMQKNPHLVASPQVDPVSVWSQIRDAALQKLSDEYGPIAGQVG